MFEVNRYKPRYNVRLIIYDLESMPPEERKKYEVEQSRKYVEMIERYKKRNKAGGGNEC